LPDYNLWQSACFIELSAIGGVVAAANADTTVWPLFKTIELMNTNVSVLPGDGSIVHTFMLVDLLSWDLFADSATLCRV